MKGIAFCVLLQKSTALRAFIKTANHHDAQILFKALEQGTKTTIQQRRLLERLSCACLVENNGL